MLQALLALATVSAAAAGPIDKTTSVSADMLMGRWCGDGVAIVFTPRRLTVAFSDGSAPSIFRIKTIVSVEGGLLNVLWDPRDGGSGTVYGEFTGDSMAQEPNDGGDMGPRRAFHRC